MDLNAGQNQFLTFILERVQNGKEEDAKSLLTESFRKPADRTFSEEYKNNFIPQILALLKSEKVDEVKNVMINFKNSK